MNTNIIKAIIKMTLLFVPAIFSFGNDDLIADDVPFSRVRRIDWNLAEVKNNTAVLVIDRAKVQMEIYSVRFKEDHIQGRGACNIYSAPYTAGENNSLSIKRIAASFMAPLFEMKNFKERDYFRLLEKVYRWELQDWVLKLYTRDEDNEEVILEFVPIYK